jgi:hypothetical protein
LNAVPRIFPLSPDTPEGRSTATTGTLAALHFPIAFAASPSIAFDRPAPNSASIMTDTGTIDPDRGENSVIGFASIGHSAAAVAASVPCFGRPSAQRRTGMPASLSSLATT